MILDPQALRLAQWFAGLQERVGQLVEDRLHGACALQLEHVSDTLQSTAQIAGPPTLAASAITPPPGTTAGLLAPGTPVGDGGEDDSLFVALLGPGAAPNPVEPGLRDAPPLERAPEPRGWKAALEQDIRPAIHRARGTLRAAAASFSDGSALASLRDEVDTTLARTPENLSLDVAPEDSSSGASAGSLFSRIDNAGWARYRNPIPVLAALVSPCRARNRLALCRRRG